MIIQQDGFTEVFNHLQVPAALARAVLLRVPVMRRENAELIVLQASKERDPDGRKLSAAIHAHYAFERMREIRWLLIHVVAVLGVFVVPFAAWPQLDASPLRRLTLAFWALAFAGLVTASIQEQWHLQRRLRLTAALHGEGRAGPPDVS